MTFTFNSQPILVTGEVHIIASDEDYHLTLGISGSKQFSTIAGDGVLRFATIITPADLGRQGLDRTNQITLSLTNTGGNSIRVDAIDVTAIHGVRAVGPKGDKGDPGDLPDHSQTDRQFLAGSRDVLSFEAINEVPDTPGTSTGIGHVLTVNGENDQDYHWAAPTAQDAVARASAATNAANITSLETTVNNNRTGLASLEGRFDNRPALPDFPATGSRDNLIPKFNGDTLRWEADLTGSGGGSVAVSYTHLTLPTNREV